MKRSDLARLFVAGALALPLLGFAPGAALAAEAPQRPAEEPVPASEIAPYGGNYGNDGYYFRMHSKGRSSATGYRPKGTTSGVYVGITDTFGTPRMYADGAYSAAGSGYVDATVGIARARSKGNYRLRNMVREWGRTHVRLTSWAEYGDSKVTGQWSPDCRPAYPYLGA